MTNERIYEKLQKLMASYVPEFSYEPENHDPGSVLTTLCGDMIADSQKRFDNVLYKHRIQYLNLFEAMKKEPVSASKGYVQFSPVSGYEEEVLVPKGTQVMSAGKQGEIIFETLHDMSVTATEPELVAVADRDEDCIIKIPYQSGSDKEWKAFDIQGENQAEHKLYLCFEKGFEYLNRLDFLMNIEMGNEEMQQEALEVLASDKVNWSILEESGEKSNFDAVTVKENKLHFIKEDFIPQKSVLGQREGYILILEGKKELPELFIHRITIEMNQEHILPEALLVNGISESLGAVLPFGKPLSLYQEFVIVSKEVLSKKGARIALDFDLDYVVHEEILEIPEADLEYKVIMKKPKKALEIPAAQVLAEYVVWEYLSKTGWKQIWRDEHIAVMFNGNTDGHMRLTFQCPEDMEDDPQILEQGCIRARLMRAENIYKVPAVYKCPRITGMNLSYYYEEGTKAADYAVIRNSFEEQDITKELQQGTAVKIFYNQENKRRSMYFGFSRPLSGTPVSMYFDLENYNDVPIDFTVEYLSTRGFVLVKNLDGTDGFLGSGNMLLMIPKDMKKARLYGYEGYFIRFVNYNPQIKEYELPMIRGIYMNMAKVVNTNVVTEEFYLEDFEHSADIKLSQENLIRVQVWAREIVQDSEEWVLWEQRPGFSKEGRSYQIDMAQGILHLEKQVLTNGRLSAEGSHFLVKHCNYTGAQANVEAGMVDTLRNSVRYISSVTNPFPTYGGYDGYTQQSAQRLVSSMLCTRNRAVTARDFFHIISQLSFGIRKVKCASNVDLSGNPKPGTITVAVLIDEYEKGMQIFSELKETIRRKLLETSNLIPTGKELLVTQPHFIRVNVRLWLEKENMEQAYELQSEALKAIREFIDPLNGGIRQNGWEIGDFPRQDQIIAYLRTRLSNCEISKMVMTAVVDGTEITVRDKFYESLKNPFILAVNGEHIVYIDIV